MTRGRAKHLQISVIVAPPRRAVQPSYAASRSRTRNTVFADHGAPAGVAAAFRRSLAEAGYVDGRNVTIEYRWAENDNALLPALAADLVRRRVAVGGSSRGAPMAAIAAKAATPTITLIFLISAHTVKICVVVNLSRPGGNVSRCCFL